MGCGSSLQAVEAAHHQQLIAANEAAHQQLIAANQQLIATNERLIGLLELQSTGHHRNVSPQVPYGELRQTQQLALASTEILPDASTRSRNPTLHPGGSDFPLAIRKELRQLQSLKDPTCALNELLRRGDIVNTLTKAAVEQASELEKAADDASDEGLLSKGQILLELSTRIDAATILTLREEPNNINNIPGRNAGNLMSSLLNAAAASAEFDRLSHRLVCILTSTSRLVIVLHRAVAEKGKSILPKDAVKEWRSALNEVRRCSRKWTNHTHVQNLLGLQLTLIESGLMALPDPTTKGKAAASSAKLVLGIAKSVLTMKVDDVVFSELTKLATLAIEQGGRHLAYTCFSQLRLVEEARALAYQARRVGKDAEIRFMVSKLFGNLQGRVRWECMASFITMLGDILLIGDGLQEISPDTIKYICLGEDKGPESGVSGNKEPISAKSDDAQPVFGGLLGLLSLGDDKSEHGDPTAVGTVLLADCASRLTSCERVDTWMEELHGILCAQVDQLVGTVRAELDSVLQKLLSDVCDPLIEIEVTKDKKIVSEEVKKKSWSSRFLRGSDAKTRNAETVSKQSAKALDELIQGLETAMKFGEKLTNLLDAADKLLTWLCRAVGAVSTVANATGQAVDTVQSEHEKKSHQSGQSPFPENSISSSQHVDQVRSQAAQADEVIRNAKTSLVSLVDYIETGRTFVTEFKKNTEEAVKQMGDLKKLLDDLKKTLDNVQKDGPINKEILVSMKKLKVEIASVEIELNSEQDHEEREKASLNSQILKDSSSVVDSKIGTAILGTKKELDKLVCQMKSNTLREKSIDQPLFKLTSIDAHLDALRDMTLKFKQEAKKELEQVAEEFKSALHEQVPEHIEEICGALVLPIVDVAKSWWKGRRAKKETEMWRARAYAAMHLLRVLAMMRDDCVDSRPTLSEVRRALERGIVRRQAFESSGAVSTILRQGEVSAAELSVDLWRAKLQNASMSYKEAVVEVKDEIASTMKVELELLESTSGESTMDDAYLEQQRLVHLRTRRAKMEVCCQNVAAIEKASGETMDFLKGMKEQLCKIDTKLDAIKDKLVTMDLKLDCVLKDTHELLYRQEAAARMQAERHQELLDGIRKDKGFYLYFAFQPPPTVSDDTANQMRFRQQIDDFEMTLNDEWTQFHTRRAFPISLNDANADNVRDDLQKGRVHILVWCATGYGWETPCGVEPIGLEELLKATLPQVIIVVLKYGAQRAAQLLFENVKPGTVVVYVQADMQGDDGRKILPLIAHLAWELHESESAELEKVIKTLRMGIANKLNDPEWNMAGYFSTVRSQKIMWKPEDASQSEWVLKNAVAVLNPAFSNMTNRRANLARQKVLSCDLATVNDLKRALKEGTHTVYALLPNATVSVSGLKWRKIDATPPALGEKLVQGENVVQLAAALSEKTVFTEEEWDAFGIKDLHTDDIIESKGSYFKPVDNSQVSRCMAVALAACSSFVLATGLFDAVFEIETREDLDRVKNVVNSSHWSSNNKLLLWTHLQDAEDGVSDAEKGLLETWTEEMSKDVIALMTKMKSGNARLILTSDDSVKWGNSEEMETMAKKIHEASISMPDDSNHAPAWGQGFFEVIRLPHSVDNTISCAHHEEIKIFPSARGLKRQVGGVPSVGGAKTSMEGNTEFEPCDLINLFAGKHDALQEAIKDALPGVRGDGTQRPIAAMYSDVDEKGRIALVVRISISDVAYLHELRDSVLTKGFGSRFSDRLCEVVRDKLPHVLCKPGLKWKEIGLEKPTEGDKIQNPKLATDLQRKKDQQKKYCFSDEELKEFQVADLSHKSYIQVGETYFTTDIGFKTIVDLTHFASAYEKSVFSLDSLTPHQIKKLRECEGTGDRHLEAPAGAGKTFVALFRMLEEIAEQNKNNSWVLKKSGSSVLFVARNPALAYFVAQWLSTRFTDRSIREKALSQLHTLVEPFDVGPRQCCVHEGQITFVEPSEQRSYALFVVDEAHHVYRDSTKRAQVEKHVSGTTRRLLLSDISQSEVDDIRWPTCTDGQPIRKVQLTEVVRCSQRIVAGAAAFQLGEKKRETKSMHAASGPPLRSYLFERPPKEEELMTCYAEEVMKALADVVQEFPGLDLHNRLAFIVQSPGMVEDLRPLLTAKLQHDYPLRNFEIINAQKASASVDDTVRGRTEWLVLDHMANFDGLERLIVICIDLDSVLEDPQSDVRETRSLLYRGLTRAHMMVSVVNVFLAGGWLEFLTRCRLDSEKKDFDQTHEMENIDDDAVDNAVNSVLEKAIADERLHKDAQTAIKQTVMEQISKKVLAANNTKAIEEAVSKASRQWRDHEKEMKPSVQKYAKMLGFDIDIYDITNDENKLSQTCGRAVALWRRDNSIGAAEVHDVLQATDDTVEKAVLTALEELVPNILMTHAAKESEGGRELLEEESEALSQHVISPKLRGQSPMRLKQACKDAIIEWDQLLKQAHAELPLQSLLSEETAPGLKWKEVAEKPQTGIEIENKALASDLQRKTHFSAEEWDKFNLREISYDSYIKVEDKYFKPAEKDKRERTWKELQEEALVERLAATRAPALIALEVLRDRNSEREKLIQTMAQDFLAVLVTAMAEKEELNAAKLLELSRQVATLRVKSRASEVRHDSSEHIAKGVVRTFCISGALSKAANEAKLKLSAAEKKYLSTRTADAISRGRDATRVIVQHELNIWIETRREVNLEAQAKFKTTEFDLRLEAIVSSAIDAVAGGADINAAVNKAVGDERLHAAVCAAAESLNRNLNPRELETLKQALGSQSLNDQALRTKAEEAIEKMRTEDSAGVSATQCIWDTEQNSAARRDGDLKFNPLGKVSGVDVDELERDMADPLGKVSGVDVDELERDMAELAKAADVVSENGDSGITFEDVKECMAGPFALKNAISKMRPILEPHLAKVKLEGAAWEDVVSVIAASGITMEDVKECAETGMVDPIMLKLAAKAAGPLALKIAIAKARPILEPHLARVKLEGAAWEDVVSVIDASDITIEDIQECVKDGDIGPIEKKLLEAATKEGLRQPRKLRDSLLR